MITPVYPILELPLLEDHQGFVIKVLYSRGDLHLKGELLDIFIMALIPRHLKALIFGMVIVIIAGIALGALAHSTPLINLLLKLIVTSYKQIVTRKIKLELDLISFPTSKLVQIY